MKKWFVVLFAWACFLFSPIALGSPVDYVQTQFQTGHGNDVLKESLDNLVGTAVFVLKSKGFDSRAKQIETEWRDLFLLGDMGDHQALSTWLTQLYDQLLSLLGPSVMKLTHLSDIKVFNYGIPVVMHPSASEQWCLETLKTNPSDSCKVEFRRHFAGTEDHDGLMPVVTYWVAWGICEGLTFSSGWFLICTPFGNLFESAAATFVASKLSDTIYDRAN